MRKVDNEGKELGVLSRAAKTIYSFVSCSLTYHWFVFK